MEYIRDYESLSNLVSTKRLTPAQAIKYACLVCCCFQPNEVKLCVSKTCPLWRYRTGKEERDALYQKTHKARKPITNEQKEKMKQGRKTKLKNS